MKPIRARNHVRRQVVKLVAVVVLAYFAGVGIGFVVGLPDPWIHGFVSCGSVAGGSFAGFWVARRARRDKR